MVAGRVAAIAIAIAIARCELGPRPFGTVARHETPDGRVEESDARETADAAVDSRGDVKAWGSNVRGGLGHAPDASDAECKPDKFCNAGPMQVGGLPGAP